MTPTEVVWIALDLMRDHGLLAAGWTFEVSRNNRCYGKCYWDRKLIRISGPLSAINSPEETRNTILHEIAHALAPRGAGHGPLWKRVCVNVGCEPIACYGEAVTRPTGGWLGTCPNCGHTWNKYRRPTGQPRACKRCCDAHNGGRFSPRFVFVWAEL